MALALPVLALWLVMNVALLAVAAVLERRRRAREIRAGVESRAGIERLPGRVLPKRLPGVPG